MRVFGKGFNFAQDGPENRLVYHLSGCNMACIWCSNADGMDDAYINLLRDEYKSDADYKLDFERARRMLCTSDLPITEICYNSGFTSLSHFLRMFTGKYGQSPNVYRKKR